MATEPIYRAAHPRRPARGRKQCIAAGAGLVGLIVFGTVLGRGFVAAGQTFPEEFLDAHRDGSMRRALMATYGAAADGSVTSTASGGFDLSEFPRILFSLLGTRSATPAPRPIAAPAVQGVDERSPTPAPPTPTPTVISTVRALIGSAGNVPTATSTAGTISAPPTIRPANANAGAIGQSTQSVGATATQVLPPAPTEQVVRPAVGASAATVDTRVTERSELVIVPTAPSVPERSGGRFPETTDAPTRVPTESVDRQGSNPPASVPSTPVPPTAVPPTAVPPTPAPASPPVPERSGTTGTDDRSDTVGWGPTRDDRQPPADEGTGTGGTAPDRSGRSADVSPPIPTQEPSRSPEPVATLPPQTNEPNRGRPDAPPASGSQSGNQGRGGSQLQRPDSDGSQQPPKEEKPAEDKDDEKKNDKDDDKRE